MKFNKTSALKQLMLLVSVLVSVLVLSGCVIHSQRTNSNSDRSNFSTSATAANSESIAVRDISKVNGSVVVEAGDSLSNIRTVNGRVTVKSRATAGNVHTVNGRVVLGKRVLITGNVETVNGRISAIGGGEISGSATTVNGRIQIGRAHV